MLVIHYGTAAERDTGAPCVIDYYLTESDIRKEYCDLKKYGIFIKKRSPLPCGIEVDAKYVPDVFYRLGDARKFLDMLIAEKIPPAHFGDAVETYTRALHT